jgi:hypothetical protein
MGLTCVAYNALFSIKYVNLLDQDLHLSFNLKDKYGPMCIIWLVKAYMCMLHNIFGSPIIIVSCILIVFELWGRI